MTPANDSIDTRSIGAVIESPERYGTGSGELNILFRRVNVANPRIDGVSNTVRRTSFSLRQRRPEDPILWGGRDLRSATIVVGRVSSALRVTGARIGNLLGANKRLAA
jgi:hypothetical protein